MLKPLYMRCLYLTVLFSIVFATSCNLTKPDGVDNPLVVYFGSHPLGGDISCELYTSEADSKKERNPIKRFVIPDKGGVELTDLTPNTKYYYSCNSDDHKTTNWATGKDTFTTLDGGYHGTSLSFDYETSSRRVLLPNNTEQSVWKVVGYREDFGELRWDSLMNYEDHCLIINRDCSAVFDYKTKDGKSITEQLNFSVYNNSHFPRNSFNVYFELEDKEVDEASPRWIATGPFHNDDWNFFGYLNRWEHIAKETDFLMLSDGTAGYFLLVFKRM